MDCCNVCCWYDCVKGMMVERYQTDVESINYAGMNIADKNVITLPGPSLFVFHVNDVSSPQCIPVNRVSTSILDYVCWNEYCRSDGVISM